jgi:hypothetical protein
LNSNYSPGWRSFKFKLPYNVLPQKSAERVELKGQSIYFATLVPATTRQKRLLIKQTFKISSSD